MVTISLSFILLILSINMDSYYLESTSPLSSAEREEITLDLSQNA